MSNHFFAPKLIVSKRIAISESGLTTNTSQLTETSLIVIVDRDTQLDDRVWELTRALGAAATRAEVLIVDPTQETQHQRVTFRPIPPSFPTLGQAIRQARFETVTIVDAGAPLTSSRWQELERLNQHAVRVAVDVAPEASRSKKFWTWLLMFLTRCLLKTRKHEFANGVSIFRTNHIQPIAEHLPGIRPGEDVVRLIGIVRMQGRPIAESVTYRVETQTEGPHLTSKNYRSAISRSIRFWFSGLMFPFYHSQIQSPKPAKKKYQWLMSIVLVVLAMGMLFGSLQFPLFEPDETRNAQIALNIQESGQWSTLSLRDEPYWNKPPLQHWMIATSQWMFGASAWSTRLPIALSSFVTVMLCFFMGRRLVGFRAAWLGSICLLMTIGFLLISRYSTMDASLTTAMTAAILFGLYSLPGIAGRSNFSRRYAMLSSVSIGVGVLLKGPLIIVLCLPPLIVAAWLMKPEAGSTITSRASKWWYYLLPAIVLAAPWYVWTSIVHPEFVEHFFWRHNVVRYVNGFDHREPFYFYLLGIFLFMFPVSYLFPSLIRYLTSRNAKYQRYRSRELGLLAIVVGWIFLFLSLSTSKLPTYVVPAFPLICLMTGVFIEQRVVMRFESNRSLLNQLVVRAPWELPAWTIVVSIVAVFWWNVAVGDVLPFVCLSVVGGFVAWFARTRMNQRRGRRLQWFAITSMGLLLASLASQVVFPAIAQSRSDQLALRQMLDADVEIEPQVVFVGRDPFFASVDVDRQRLISFREDEIDDAADYLDEISSAILVMSDDTAQNLQTQLTTSGQIKKHRQGRHVFIWNDRANNVSHVAGQRKVR
ncbi:MAG: glycosyltransferase family 39 protein [Planctomycetota bacterium]